MKIKDARQNRELSKFQNLERGNTFYTVGGVLCMKTGSGTAVRLEDGVCLMFATVEKVERVVCEITVTA